MILEELTNIARNGATFVEVFADHSDRKKRNSRVTNDDPLSADARKKYRALPQIVEQFAGAVSGAKAVHWVENIAFENLVELAEELGDTDLTTSKKPKPASLGELFWLLCREWSFVCS